MKWIRGIKMIDINELDYHQKLKLLHRLMDKMGDSIGNLSFREREYYDVLCQWYEANHRTA